VSFASCLKNVLLKEKFAEAGHAREINGGKYIWSALLHRATIKVCPIT